MKNPKLFTLLAIVIFTLWTPILWSYIHESDFITHLTYTMFGAFFFCAVTLMILLPIRSLLFNVTSGAYWIFKGEHYAGGYTRPKFRNIKMFFFKKEIEFWYKLSPNSWQSDNGQHNKIFGITSVIYRRNSIRRVFKSELKGSYTASDYLRDKFQDPLISNKREELHGQWYHAKLKAPRMIWFGFYHFPYHGGKIPSNQAYTIDISLEEPISQQVKHI